MKRHNMTYSVVAANGDAPVFRIKAYDSDFGYQPDGDQPSSEQVFLFDSSRLPGVYDPSIPDWKSDGEGSYTRDLMPSDIYLAAKALNTKYRLLDCLVGYSFPVTPSDDSATGPSAFGLNIPYEHPERVKNFPLNSNHDGWYEPAIPDADITVIRNTIRLFCAFAECAAGNVCQKPAPLRYAGTKIGVPVLDKLSYEGLFYTLAWAAVYVFDAARQNKEADPIFASIIESEGVHAQILQYLDHTARVAGHAINLKQGRISYTTEVDSWKAARAFEPWTYPRANQSRWDMGYTEHGRNNPGMWCRAAMGDIWYYNRRRRPEEMEMCPYHLRVTIELDGTETLHCTRFHY